MIFLIHAALAFQASTLYVDHQKDQVNDNVVDALIIRNPDSHLVFACSQPEQFLFVYITTKKYIGSYQGPVEYRFDGNTPVTSVAWDQKIHRADITYESDIVKFATELAVSKSLVIRFNGGTEEALVLRHEIAEPNLAAAAVREIIAACPKNDGAKKIGAALDRLAKNPR